MRLMSFALTTGQIMDGSKTVTRRLGWKFLKPGQRIQAVRKAMGLRKGESPERLRVLEVISVSRERLDTISPEDCAREGFPEMSPSDFVAMFASKMGCLSCSEITRIEFRYLAKNGEESSS